MARLPICRNELPLARPFPDQASRNNPTPLWRIARILPLRGVYGFHPAVD